MNIEERIDNYLDEDKKFEFHPRPLLGGKLKKEAEKIMKDLNLKDKVFSQKESDEVARKIIDNYGRDALDKLVNKSLALAK